MRQRVRGYLSMAIATTTWGSLPVIVNRAGAPAPVLVALRMGFGAASLGLYLVVFARREIVPRGNLLKIIGLGCVLATNWVLFFAAIKLLPGATAVLISYVFPLGVAILAPRVLREPRERHVLPLAVLGFAGLAVILAPQAGAGRALGVVLALGVAATGVVLVLAARHLAPLVAAPVIAFWQNVTGVTLLLPWALLTPAPHGVPWGWGALMGLFHTGITGVLFFRAMSAIPAQEAGVLMNLEPVSAVAFSWAFLGVSPSPASAIGGALVLGAGAAIAARGSQAR